VDGVAATATASPAAANNATGVFYLAPGASYPVRIYSNTPVRTLSIYNNKLYVAVSASQHVRFLPINDVVLLVSPCRSRGLAQVRVGTCTGVSGL
jgi:hypothetical protein